MYTHQYGTYALFTQIEEGVIMVIGGWFLAHPIWIIEKFTNMSIEVTLAFLLFEIFCTAYHCLPFLHFSIHIIEPGCQEVQTTRWEAVFFLAHPLGIIKHVHEYYPLYEWIFYTLWDILSCVPLLTIPLLYCTYYRGWLAGGSNYALRRSVSSFTNNHWYIVIILVEILLFRGSQPPHQCLNIPGHQCLNIPGLCPWEPCIDNIHCSLALWSLTCNNVVCNNVILYL